MKWSIRAAVLAALLAAAAADLSAGRGRHKEWKSIAPGDLAQSESLVEKDADAEGLFWEVWVEDAASGGTPRTVMHHYLRVKIFTETGKEEFSTHSIPYTNEMRVEDIAARTVQPDGSVHELDRSSIFEQVVVKANDVKVKTKSFAVPALSVGSIVEVRWKEVYRDHLVNFLRFPFQREIPVQKVSYFVKPLSELGRYGFAMKAITFNGPDSSFLLADDGFHQLTKWNMPAFREEPYMPPEDQLKVWMLLFYSDSKHDDPAEYWSDFGRKVHDAFKKQLEPSGPVKRTAAEIADGADSEEEKLRRLYDYCRTRIQRITDDAAGLTAEQLRKWKENKSPKDTLKRQAGTGRDIDLLFGALARAAGFEARLARIADGADVYFEPQMTSGYFLSELAIAVRSGDGWRFFKPSRSYAAFGGLPWHMQGQSALIIEKEDSHFVQTPKAGSSQNSYRRHAELVLAEDGTLEGTVRMEALGEAGAWQKERYDALDEEERLEELAQDCRRRLPGCEISEPDFENASDPLQPFAVSYHAKVSNYAVATGKRLLVQPAFFQAGREPRFTAGRRVHPIHFRWSWSEQDTVQLQLPKGFALENPESPEPLSAEDTAAYEARIEWDEDSNRVLHRREFRFEGAVFAAPAYPRLKQLFDLLHERDSLSLVLRRTPDAETEVDDAR